MLHQFLKENPTLIKNMKNCFYYYEDIYENKHHLEGDVWSHTLMSYCNTQKYQTSVYVMWAILLHDIGRIEARTENHKERYVSFGDFEGLSVFMSKEILDKTMLTNIEKIRILKIISYQYTIIDYIKYQHISKKELLQFFKYEEELLYDLSQYVKCDLLGRIVDESREHLYDENKMDIFINYAKKINLDKENSKGKDKKNTVYILVGPPCSKKSTWAKNNIDNAIVINRDSCVEEVGKRYNINSYDEAYYYMKKHKEVKKIVDQLDEEREKFAKNSSGKDIIIDNPNIKIKNRKEWVDAFKDTHIIKAIVFLSSFNTLLECNKNRGENIHKNITKRELKSKLKTFQYPLLGEGIDIVEHVF